MDINLLPDHVLIIVFCHIGNYDLLNCRAVCWRWFKLLQSKKYFQRIHCLNFESCRLSTNCPPFSLFVKPIIPFVYNKLIVKSISELPDPNALTKYWNIIGKHIINLKLDKIEFIGNGSAWINLEHLEVHELMDASANENVVISPAKLEIPSLRTLRLYGGRYVNFPRNLCDMFPRVEALYTDYSPELDEWIQHRLRGLCIYEPNWPAQQLLELELEELGIQVIGDLLKLMKVQLQPNVIKWYHVCPLPLLENVTELFLELQSNLVADFKLEKMSKTLKKLQIECFDTNPCCFFGHDVIELPCLKELAIRTVWRQCDQCYRTCLRSCRSICKFEIWIIIMNSVFDHIWMLQELEYLTVNVCCRDDDIIFEEFKWPSLPIRTLDFRFDDIKGFDLACQVLKNSKCVEKLIITAPDKTFRVVDGFLSKITVCTTNLRALTVRSNVIESCTEDDRMFITRSFEQLPLLLKICYNGKMTTRSSCEINKLSK